MAKPPGSGPKHREPERRSEASTWPQAPDTERLRVRRSPEYLWRALCRRQQQIDVVPGRSRRAGAERRRAPERLTDLPPLMLARAELVAQPDFTPRRYPGLRADLPSDADEGWIAWSILPELRTVLHFATRIKHRRTKVIRSMVAAATRMAEEFVQDRIAASGLSFDDLARGRALIPGVLAGKGTGGRDDLGQDPSEPERQRVNALLGIESPWELPEPPVPVAQSVIDQLSRRGRAQVATIRALEHLGLGDSPEALELRRSEREDSPSAAGSALERRAGSQAAPSPQATLVPSRKSRGERDVSDQPPARPAGGPEGGAVPTRTGDGFEPYAPPDEWTLPDAARWMLGAIDAAVAFARGRVTHGGAYLIDAAGAEWAGFVGECRDRFLCFDRWVAKRYGEPPPAEVAGLRTKLAELGKLYPHGSKDRVPVLAIDRVARWAEDAREHLRTLHGQWGASGSVVSSNPANAPERRKPTNRKARGSARRKADKVRELLTGGAPFEGTKTALASAAGYTHPSSLAKVKNFDRLWDENDRKLAHAKAERERRMKRPV